MFTVMTKQTYPHTNQELPSLHGHVSEVPHSFSKAEVRGRRAGKVALIATAGVAGANGIGANNEAYNNHVQQLEDQGQMEFTDSNGESVTMPLPENPSDLKVEIGK